jgi:hypothetical protein
VTGEKSIATLQLESNRRWLAASPEGDYAASLARLSAPSEYGAGDVLPKPDALDRRRTQPRPPNDSLSSGRRSVADDCLYSNDSHGPLGNARLVVVLKRSSLANWSGATLRSWPAGVWTPHIPMLSPAMAGATNCFR